MTRKGKMIATPDTTGAQVQPSDSRTKLTIGGEAFPVVRRRQLTTDEEQCPNGHPLYLVETAAGSFVVCDVCSTSRAVPLES